MNEKQSRERSGQKIEERFEFREIRPEEAGEAAQIEKACFPPNEACTEVMMRERAAKAPEVFLVAVDRKSGKMAGFLNGLATDEAHLRDEFFQNADLHAPEGENIMLLGLCVLPEYRRQHLATKIVSLYGERERARGRKKLILTCLDSRIRMYENMGFLDHGMSDSSWGGEKWHEMSLSLLG